MSGSGPDTQPARLEQAFALLREDAARDLIADRARVAGLAQRLGAELSAPATAAAAPISSGGALASALPLKLGGGLLLIGALAAGLLLDRSTDDASTTQRLTSDSTSVAQRSPRPSARLEPPARKTSEAPTEATQETEGTLASQRTRAPDNTLNGERDTRAGHVEPRRTRRSKQPTSQPRPTLEQEIALIERASAAVQRDPQTTLSLCREHASRYPRGVFVQEREVLAIEALLGAQRRRAAEARARAFMERFPRSSHAHRVQKLIFRRDAKTSSASTGDTGASRPHANTDERSP